MRGVLDSAFFALIYRDIFTLVVDEQDLTRFSRIPQARAVWAPGMPPGRLDHVGVLRDYWWHWLGRGPVMEYCNGSVSATELRRRHYLQCWRPIARTGGASNGCMASGASPTLLAGRLWQPWEPALLADSPLRRFIIIQTAAACSPCQIGFMQMRIGRGLVLFWPWFTLGFFSASLRRAKDCAQSAFIRLSLRLVRVRFMTRQTFVTFLAAC